MGKHRIQSQDTRRRGTHILPVGRQCPAPHAAPTAGAGFHAVGGLSAPWRADMGAQRNSDKVRRGEGEGCLRTVRVNG